MCLIFLHKDLLVIQIFTEKLSELFFKNSCIKDYQPMCYICNTYKTLIHEEMVN